MQTAMAAGEARYKGPLCGVSAEEMAEGGHGGDTLPDLLIDADEDRRFLHYQPWLRVGGEKLAELVTEAFSAIPAPQITPGRKPRVDAAMRRKLCVENILANLVVMALSPIPFDGLVVTLNRKARTRYDRAEFSLQVLNECLLGLQFLGIIFLEAGQCRRTSSVVTVADGFVSRLHQQGVTLGEVVKGHGAETILLRDPGSRGRVGELRDYEDDACTVEMRREMEELNAALNAADIRLNGQAVPPIHMVRIFQYDPASPWSRHGRLYRGFPWLDLPKGQRHLLTIGGQPVVDIDWSACFLHIAYSMAACEFPRGDPYAIPGLESHRATVKLITNALFFRSEPTDAILSRKGFTPRLPRGTRQALPEGWNGKRFLEALSLKHPAIAHLFGVPGIGFRFMKLEGDMMLSVLKELREAGAVGLPQHDGLLTQQTTKAQAITAMEAVSKRFLGRPIPAVEKPIFRPVANNSHIMGL